MREPRLQRLRVLGTEAADLARRQHPKSDRHAGTAARHVAKFRCVIGNLVHADHCEIVDHDLGDRLHASQRSPDGGADDRLFGYRRAPHPFAAVLGGKPVGRFDDATSRIFDVLAQQEHRRVAGQRDVHRFGHRLAEGDLAARRRQFRLGCARGLGMAAFGAVGRVCEHVDQQFRIGRRWRRDRKSLRRIYFGKNLSFDGGKIGLGCHTVGDEPGAPGDERRFGACARQFRRVHMPFVRTEGVALQPVRDTFQQGRPFAGAGPRHRPPGCRIQSVWIGAVDLLARHPVGSGARGDVRRCRRVRKIGIFGIKIVLADEHHGQFPQRGQVQRLVHRADVGGAVTEAANGDAPRPLHLGGKRQPGGDWRACTDDAGRCHQPAVWVRQVHRPALALGCSGCLAVHLRHDFVQRCALGHDVVDAAIGDDAVIIGLQVQRDGGRNRFLPAARIILELQIACREALLDAPVGGPDQRHGAIDPHRIRWPEFSLVAACT